MFKTNLNGVLLDKWGQPLAMAGSMPKNARKTTIDNSIVAKIITEFQNRHRAEIQAWQQALNMAKNPEDPRLYLLQDMFDNLESDGHYISERELRKSATLCADISIIERATGKIDFDRTEKFREEWFYNFREDALNFIFKGQINLELIDPQRLIFELIPPRNVAPVKNRVYTEVGGSKFYDLNDPIFEHRIVRIGKAKNYGLLADLCGQLIWKRNAQQSWAEFTEKYGQPLITATSNKTAQADIDKIDQMLMNLGEAARAVLPEGTTIDIKPFTGGDSFNVYDRQIERINTEISKPIVGGTMITDNGSSRSQSEVHERNLDEKIAARDKLIIEYITNGQLIPLMHKWGHDIDPEKHQFTHDASFELSLKDYWEVVSDAHQYYDIDPEWVSKTFNIRIDGVRERTPQIMVPAAFAGRQKDTPQNKSKKDRVFSANFR